MRELSAAFALAVPREEALAIRDNVGFFQAVRAGLIKTTVGDGRREEDLEHAVRQIVSRAVISEGVIDIYVAAGLKRPDISILSDAFLSEVRDMPQRNLAIEVLRKLLNDELRTQERRNLIQSRRFSEMLEQAIRSYQNRTLDWTVKESVRADIRRRVKRLLRKYGYPPDKQEQATQAVLEQAELLCADWAEEPNPNA